MTEIWLSIIIPVKSETAELDVTLESIARQALDGVEVLVVSSSQNPTNSSSVTSLSIKTVVAASRGVYHAMNIGLRAARGKYVYFLGVGDRLIDPLVLKTVRECLHVRCPQWAFGSVLFQGEDGSLVQEPPWDYGQEKKHLFARGKFPQHQSVFAERQVLLQLGLFKESYRIAADYRMGLELACRYEPLRLNRVIAVFVEGGLSSRAWRKSLIEFHRARREVFKPKGVASWLEIWASITGAVKMFLYRDLVARLSR